jgi:hypothetical protein
MLVPGFGTHIYYRSASAQLQAARCRDNPAFQQVFVLSLWREALDAPWRAALRAAGSQKRLGFADLQALARFLVRLNDSDERFATESTQITGTTEDAAETTVALL